MHSCVHVHDYLTPQTPTPHSPREWTTTKALLPAKRPLYGPVLHDFNLSALTQQARSVCHSKLLPSTSRQEGGWGVFVCVCFVGYFCCFGWRGGGGGGVQKSVLMIGVGIHVERGVRVRVRARARACVCVCVCV